MKRISTVIFGNGLTIGFLNNMKNLISEKYANMFNIDNYLRAYINDELGVREKRFFETKIWNNKSKIDHYSPILKAEMKRFYLYANMNIEYFIGYYLFDYEKFDFDYSIMRSIFPLIYNIWFDQVMSIIDYCGKKEELRKYYIDFTELFSGDCEFLTTNFDLFADEIIEAQHLHGRFVRNVSKINDLILFNISDEEFLWKQVWGWNGIGKMGAISQIRDISQDCLDSLFFFDSEKNFGEILIYGLGFQKSGYTARMENFKERYKKPVSGGIIDEHILIKIKSLQEQGRASILYLTYYSENESQHLKDVLSEIGIVNYVLLKSTEVFNYTI